MCIRDSSYSSRTCRIWADNNQLGLRPRWLYISAHILRVLFKLWLRDIWGVLQIDIIDIPSGTISHRWQSDSTVKRVHNHRNLVFCFVPFFFFVKSLYTFNLGIVISFVNTSSIVPWCHYFGNWDKRSLFLETWSRRLRYWGARSSNFSTFFRSHVPLFF